MKKVGVLYAMVFVCVLASPMAFASHDGGGDTVTDESVGSSLRDQIDSVTSHPPATLWFSYHRELVHVGNFLRTAMVDLNMSGPQLEDLASDFLRLTQNYDTLKKGAGKWFTPSSQAQEISNLYKKAKKVQKELKLVETTDANDALRQKQEAKDLIKETKASVAALKQIEKSKDGNFKAYDQEIKSLMAKISKDSKKSQELSVALQSEYVPSLRGVASAVQSDKYIMQGGVQKDETAIAKHLERIAEYHASEQKIRDRITGTGPKGLGEQEMIDEMMKGAHKVANKKTRHEKADILGDEIDAATLTMEAGIDSALLKKLQSMDRFAKKVDQRSLDKVENRIGKEVNNTADLAEAELQARLANADFDRVGVELGIRAGEANIKSLEQSIKQSEADRAQAKKDRSKIKDSF